MGSSSRPKSTLSFGRTSNHKSSSSIPKVTDLTETKKEKSARRLTGTKANPSLAINEAQPAALQLEQTTIENIRSLQHRDASGNVITDPDLSNPTRPRLERPLDTIRSFEAAIDGSYNRRSYARPETTDGMNGQSRRSSSIFPGYFQGTNGSQRYQGDNGGYHGNRMSSRLDSYVDGYNQPLPPIQGRRFGPRTNSDPALYGNNSQLVYPNQGYQQSYDTVTSASGTGSHATDQWGNSTDPSSENSSIDRLQQVSKQDTGEPYGFNGFGGAPHLQGPILEEHRLGGPAYGQPGYGETQRMPGTGPPYQGNGMPPPVLPKDQVSRSPIKLGPPANGPVEVNGYVAKSYEADKRQSWLKRRFSKKN